MADQPEEKKKPSWLRKNKYFSTTPISAFLFINESSSKIEIVFWYIIVVIFSVFTFLNVSELVRQYSSGKTVTRMQLGRSSNLTVFPNMVFCARMSLPELNSEYFKVHERPKPTSSLLENIPPLQDEVNKALKVFDTKEKMIATGQWGYVLLPLLFRYFSAMSITEIKPRVMVQSRKSDMAEISLSVKDFFNSSHNYIFDAVSSIRNHAKALEVSDTELFHRFAKELISFSAFSISQVSYNLEFFVPVAIEPELRLLTFSGGNYPVYCTMAPEHKLHNITVIPDSHNLIMVSASLIKRDYILNETYGFTYQQLQDSLPPKPGDGDEQFVVLLGGELGVHDFMRGSGFSVNFGKQAITHVKHAAVYQSITECSDEKSMDHCLFKCKVNIIRKVCGCSPLLEVKAKFNTNASDELCELQSYFHCLNNTEVVDEHGKCEDQCISPCFDAENRIEDAYWRGWTREPRATVFIYADDSDYPIFVEQYAQTWQSFIGELGGTVDFYLGASVIAFIHLFIYIFKQVLYLINRRYGPVSQWLNKWKQRKDMTTQENNNNPSAQKHIHARPYIEDSKPPDFRERMRRVEKTLSCLVASFEQMSDEVKQMLENEKVFSDELTNGKGLI